MFSSSTWFPPDSEIDSKPAKRDWGSIKLTQRGNRADLGVRESVGGAKESQEKQNNRRIYRFGWKEEQRKTKTREIRPP